MKVVIESYHCDVCKKEVAKDELIEYIHDIYHNWKSCDYVYNNAIDENYRLYNQLVERSRDVKSKDERIEELTRNQPLKFEEIKNMIGNPIFDINRNKWGIVTATFEWSTGLMIDIVYLDGSCIHDKIIKFEENRFYRHEVKDDENKI